MRKKVNCNGKVAAFPKQDKNSGLWNKKVVFVCEQWNAWTLSCVRQANIFCLLFYCNARRLHTFEWQLGMGEFTRERQQLLSNPFEQLKIMKRM